MAPRSGTRTTGRRTFIGGQGKVTEVASGREWSLSYGTTYLVGPEDQHVLENIENMHVLSVFCPPLAGTNSTRPTGPPPQAGRSHLARSNPNEGSYTRTLPLFSINSCREFPCRRRAGTHEIAHRLMGFVRRPDLGEFAGPVQPRQLHSVAAVRLHPLAWPAWNQGRGDHAAFVTRPSINCCSS